MGRFIPSRLVVVRHYPASFGSRGPASPADADCRVLRTQGIDAQVKSVFRGNLSLMVPEPQYEAAKDILSTVPDLYAPHDIAPRCPRCHSEHPYARPPYALAAVLIGLAMGIVVVSAGYVNAAVGIGVLGVATAVVMQAQLPHWKCRSCGRLYS